MKKMFLSILLFAAVSVPAAKAQSFAGSDMTAADTRDGLSYVEIYPNPVKTFLTVELQNFESWIHDVYSVTVYNSLGKLMVSEEFSAGTHKVDCSAFEPGLYFVEIKCGENKITRRIQREE